MSSRAFFFAGAAGCIINVIATVVLIFYDALILYAYPDVWSALFPIFQIGLVGGVLLSIGVHVAAVGYLGFRRNYGYSLGVVAFILGIIVSILGAIESVILPSWFFIVSVLFDVMVVLWGVTHIISGKFTSKKRISMGTGIMLAITGNVGLPLSMVYSLVSFVGWPALFIYDIACRVLFFVSEILAITLFFMAQVPAKELE